MLAVRRIRVGCTAAEPDHLQVFFGSYLIKVLEGLQINAADD